MDGDKIYSDSGEIDEEFAGVSLHKTNNTKASEKDYGLNIIDYQ